MVRWDEPTYVAWNLAATLIGLAALVAVLRRPRHRFGRDGSAKTTWAVLILAGSLSVRGHYVPVVAVAWFLTAPMRQKPAPDAGETMGAVPGRPRSVERLLRSRGHPRS